MSVQRYDLDCELCEDGVFVQYEDFDTVLLALRVIYKSCVTFTSHDPNDTTAAAIRDYFQKIVDQYE
jgi:hypothetical protein